MNRNGLQSPIQFEDFGCEVEDALPDLSDADEIFKTQRAAAFATGLGEVYKRHKDQMKETVIWNIEAGLRLNGEDLSRAEILRTKLYLEVLDFMQTYEFLVLPVSQVPPFDIETEWVSEIGGVEMDTYIDWMKSCYYITVLSLPTISVPCGFTDEGLPIGLQIVGRPRQERAVLKLAYAFQQATEVWRRRPTVAGES